MRREMYRECGNHCTVDDTLSIENTGIVRELSLPAMKIL
jgi:hypothetical protein